jgi:hypothetical protein
MASLKRQDSDGLTESLTEIRIKFARKTGWYIPKLHDRYLQMVGGD